jgi:hypothetical protein
MNWGNILKQMFAQVMIHTMTHLLHTYGQLAGLGAKLSLFNKKISRKRMLVI